MAWQHAKNDVPSPVPRSTTSSAERAATRSYSSAACRNAGPGGKPSSERRRSDGGTNKWTATTSPRRRIDPEVQHRSIHLELELDTQVSHDRKIAFSDVLRLSRIRFEIEQNPISALVPNV